MLKGLFSKSLSLKIAATVIAVLTVLGGGSFFYIYNKIQNQLIDAQKREALTLASTLVSSLDAMMLKGGGLKPEEIQAIFLALEERKEIKNAVVYGHNGRRAFTNHGSERNTFVNRETAEECLVCHRLSPDKMPLTQLINLPGEGRVLRAVAPIVKKEACLQCHFTGSTIGFVLPNEKYRGMLLVDIENKEMDREMESLLLTIFAAGIATSIAIILAVYFVFRKLVTQPMHDVIKPVKDIGAGKLSTYIDIKREDSIGILVNSINSMTNSLKTLVARVNAAAGWVEIATEEVGNGTIKLKNGIEIQEKFSADISKSIEGMGQTIVEISDGAAKLALVSEETSASVLEITASREELNTYMGRLGGAVDEVTSSVTQMISSIKDVASNIKVLSEGAAETASSMVEINASLKEIEGNARTSGEISRKAVQDAGDGKISVEETIKGITETRDGIKLSALTLEEFGHASKEIEKILLIINQIAKQTNLLALNASIIASQAGEYGKSFAVVASEIKKLSDQTALSTKEIGEIITRLQTEGNKAAQVMRIAENGIDNNVMLVLKAGDVLNRILESSEKSRDLVDIIGRATQEQVSGTTAATQAVERINEMIKKITKVTEEQNEAAEFVSQTMENMKDLTSQVNRATKEQTKGSKHIANSTLSVINMVQHIQKAVDGQKAESENVIKNLQDIIDVIKTNSNIAKEMSEAVKVLSSQVHTLKDEMGRFSI